MACGAAIAGAFASLVSASAAPVVIGTEAPCPPCTFIDQAGVLTGFDKDVADEVCLRAMLECMWVTTRFDALIPGVMAGDCDIIMGGIGRRRERMALRRILRRERCRDGRVQGQRRSAWAIECGSARDDGGWHACRNPRYMVVNQAQTKNTHPTKGD
jgi:Bacterial extracellular solute-binding proteins, family 3